MVVDELHGRRIPKVLCVRSSLSSRRHADDLGFLFSHETSARSTPHRETLKLSMKAFWTGFSAE
jgi:hypothetical protein